jgi:hypothetical protein
VCQNATDLGGLRGQVDWGADWHGLSARLPGSGGRGGVAAGHVGQFTVLAGREHQGVGPGTGAAKPALVVWGLTQTQRCARTVLGRLGQHGDLILLRKRVQLFCKMYQLLTIRNEI